MKIQQIEAQISDSKIGNDFQKGVVFKAFYYGDLNENEIDDALKIMSKYQNEYELLEDNALAENYDGTQSISLGCRLALHSQA